MCVHACAHTHTHIYAEPPCCHFKKKKSNLYNINILIIYVKREFRNSSHLITLIEIMMEKLRYDMTGVCVALRCSITIP